jgi:hypothetical protein
MTLAPHHSTSDPCFYCGAASEAWDHVIPQAYGTDGRVVRACTECNSSILRDVLLPSVEARCAYVAAALARRHAALLIVPVWTLSELMELAPKLRARVRRDLRKREQVIKRIEHAKAKAR